MARAARGDRYKDYIAYMGRLDHDIERMSPRAIRRYLWRRLELVEFQIRMVSDRLDDNGPGSIPTWAWIEGSVDEETWTSLANLNYLLAAREALRDTINAL